MWQFNVFEYVSSEEVNVLASSPLRKNILTALCKQTASAAASRSTVCVTLQTKVYVCTYNDFCLDLFQWYFFSPLLCPVALMLLNQQAGLPVNPCNIYSLTDWQRVCEFTIHNIALFCCNPLETFVHVNRSSKHATVATSLLFLYWCTDIVSFLNGADRFWGVNAPTSLT